MTKTTIEELCEIAKSRGGQFLSNAYLGSNIKHRWRCKNGHEWGATISNIKKGSWCGVCAGLQKHTIEEMQAIAMERGGSCVSKEYTNVQTKLRWRCREGHVWNAVPYSVIAGGWCPKCNLGKKYTIKYMQAVAKRRGGACLSKEYKNCRTKLRWRCREGHEWEPTPSNVIAHGSWCPECARIALTKPRKKKYL